MSTSVQSYKVITSLLYRVAHLDNLLRTPISIGSKIKFIDTMGIGWVDRVVEGMTSGSSEVASGFPFSVLEADCK